MLGEGVTECERVQRLRPQRRTDRVADCHAPLLDPHHWRERPRLNIRAQQRKTASSGHFVRSPIEMC